MEPSFLRLTRDLAHEFPRRELITFQGNGSDHDPEMVPPSGDHAVLSLPGRCALTLHVHNKGVRCLWTDHMRVMEL